VANHDCTIKEKR